MIKWNYVIYQRQSNDWILCACVCLNVHVYLSVCACVSLCVCMCISLCVHACMCLCACICVCASAHTCVYVCVCVCMFVCMYVQYHSIATSHSLANFPQVKCLLIRVTSESKQYRQLDPREMTSARYGKTVSSTTASNEWRVVY